MFKVSPVILCGGSGTRLWPLSRANFPKQFLTLSSEISLFQEAIERINSISDISIEIGNFIIVTSEDYRYMVEDQLSESGVTNAHILLEPVGRNTCPAMTLAALKAYENHEDAILIVTPADHTVVNKELFQTALIDAVRVVSSGGIVILGSKALRPETGFGYIERENSQGTNGEFKVKRFIEKPEIENARAFVKRDEFSWNSGIFVVKAAHWMEIVDEIAPLLKRCADKVWISRGVNLNQTSFELRDFEEFESLSVDYAIMEKLPESDFSLNMLEVDVGWNDLGAWPAVWEVGAKDQHGNVEFGDTLTVDCSNSLIHSNGRLVCGVGLNGIAVIDTPDATLVVDQRNGDSRNISHLVKELSKLNRDEHLVNRKVQRPWGWYDSVDEGPGFKVKRIQVKPGASLSLQRHKHRAEHWVVVKGTAEVTNDGEVLVLEKNESTYIPMGCIHRLRNTKDYPLEIIEVQSGAYLGEDDIERLEDIYGRVDLERSSS